MKLKKTPRYLALSLLTSGASLILGFLSFGGMYAIWPILPLAVASFGLSVAYEGEIYLQNIKGAWNKLFKRDYHKDKLANEYLLNTLNEFVDKPPEKCPQFFKDYEKQLNLLHLFGHKRLDKPSREHKKQVEKTLLDMEKWFAVQLFTDPTDVIQLPSEYEKELRNWLAHHKQKECQEELSNHQRKFLGIKAFSALAGIFMSLGTTYLLVEAFSVIPLFAAIPFVAWPLLIVPMAVIAGTAYGLLTYNAITDMISNVTLRKWFIDFRDELVNKPSIRSVFIAATAALLVCLAIALTVCTAGTWWTVAQETRPLFAWMGRMPGFIMRVVNPFITGLSAVVFNLQNSSESLMLIDNASRKIDGFFSRTFESIKKSFNELLKHENLMQIINPFRLLLKITILPLRIVLFLGHLVSIGVTADRVPGISQFFSTLLGMISEGFEDFHYFVGHDHGDEDHDEDEQEHKKEILKERLGAGDGHHHEVDLPTQVLKLIFSPVYFMAASWDYLSDTRNSLSFTDAWEKQMGLKQAVSITPPPAAQQPSDNWRMEQLVYRIEHYKEKHLHQVSVGDDIAKQKSGALTGLQLDLRRLNTSDKTAIARRLAAANVDPVFTTHRFFDNGQTETSRFVEELPERVNLPRSLGA